MRATWKGVLELGTHKVPVKLYSAVQDTAVHFHLLHAADGVRVQQRLVSSDTGEPVDRSDIRKGFALEPGKFVVLTADELASLDPESSRSIELAGFVPCGAIAPAWFERPYLLGPDGGAGPYLALARALGSQQRQALVHWVMRRRSYTGVVRARGDRLVLIALRDREEVIEAPRVDVPTSRAPSDKELALAEQLVSTLEGEFEPSQFQSDYQARVRELVESKAEGKHLRLVRPRARKPTSGSLEAALRASVKGAGRTRNRSTPKEKKSA